MGRMFNEFLFVLIKNMMFLTSLIHSIRFFLFSDVFDFLYLCNKILHKVKQLFSETENIPSCSVFRTEKIAVHTHIVGCITVFSSLKNDQKPKNSLVSKNLFYKPLILIDVLVWNDFNYFPYYFMGFRPKKCI